MLFFKDIDIGQVFYCFSCFFLDRLCFCLWFGIIILSCWVSFYYWTYLNCLCSCLINILSRLSKLVSIWCTELPLFISFCLHINLFVFLTFDWQRLVLHEQTTLLFLWLFFSLSLVLVTFIWFFQTALRLNLSLVVVCITLGGIVLCLFLILSLHSCKMKYFFRLVVYS